MPEQSETKTEVTPQQAQPESQTPQQETREAVYARLYGNQPPLQTQQATQQATSTQAEPDYKSLYSSLSGEVSGLKELLTQAISGQRASQAEAAAPVVPQEDWFALLQAGKRTEAEAALISRVSNGAAAKITQETLQQALELSRTEREIEDYNNHIRNTNPDMLDVEDLISLKAEQKFRGKLSTIKNTKDYIDTYKTVVNESIDDIRKLLQRTRAAAKNEAMTTRREVLSSTTMSPNDIGRREQAGDADNQQAEPDLSPKSYIEMRKAQYQQSGYTPDLRRAMNQQGR
jgi:hypothetical protein